MATAQTRLAIASADGHIAAVAVANSLAAATGDTSPFEVAGAAVNNPWRS